MLRRTVRRSIPQLIRPNGARQVRRWQGAPLYDRFMRDSGSSAEESPTLDDVTLELRVLRDSTGVSYRAIAARIAARREAEGTPPAAATIAHTTVSDAFRLGRSRLNPILVAEIVSALGCSAEEAEQWRQRCVRARSVRRQAGASALAVERVEKPASRPEQFLAEQSVRNSALGFVSIVLGGVVLNAAGKFVNPLLGDIFFFDMIGTASVALILGPWAAALTGVLFLLIELIKGNVGDALFATTMITSGLIWGYGAQRWGMGKTLPRFLAVSALVAVVTTVMAVPIIVLYFEGAAGRGADGFVATAEALGINLWAAVAGPNLAASLIDKLLTGAAAFYIARLVLRVGRAE
ncbi:hypothetical protein ACWPKO_32280 (plasmid) [Coraliomargarita sp. W4R53]